MRFLHRPRLDHDVAEIPVLALVREAALALPRLAQDRHALVEALGRLRLGNAKAFEFAVAVALADAEIEAAAREKIECRDLFGEQHGIVPRQHHHGSAEPHAAGAAGEIAEQAERGRDLAVAGEMVLDHEQALIAELLGQEHIVDELAVALTVGAGIAARLGPAEKPELHSANSGA